MVKIQLVLLVMCGFLLYCVLHLDNKVTALGQELKEHRRLEINIEKPQYLSPDSSISSAEARACIEWACE